MKKVIAISTIVAITGAMIVVQLGSEGVILHSFISDSLLHVMLRLLLMVALFIVIATVPPRLKLVRGALSVVATIVTVGAVAEIFAGTLLLGDVMIYLLGSLALMVEAVEDDTSILATSPSNQQISTN